MPSLGTLFFNTVLSKLYSDEVVQKAVQPNPLSITLARIEIQTEGEETSEQQATIIRRRQVEFSFIEPTKNDDEDDGPNRQVVLVQIQHTTMVQSPDGIQTAAQTQHFNLVILDQKTLYLFEPLRSARHTKEIVPLVASQFPNHKLIVLGVHPQRPEKADLYCMIYVMMLADHALEFPNLSVPELAVRCFMGPGTSLQRAQQYFARLQRDIPNLPPCPIGTWVDEHKGALIGAGGAGLLGAVAFGPWGLLGGAVVGGVGGEVLYDAQKRKEQQAK